MKATNDLQDSEITVHSEGGSVCEDEAGGWLGSIGSDFRNIASCFKDNIPPVIGGVANLVQRTALSVAAEIAQLERDGELEAERRKTEDQNDMCGGSRKQLPLPWEIRKGPGNDDAAYSTDLQLMETICGLSAHEKTFLEPYKGSVPEDWASDEYPSFELNEPRIVLIRRLLDIDENLAAMHARLSGRGNLRETAFWRNYFYHCETARRAHCERSEIEQHKDFRAVLTLEGQSTRYCSLLTQDIKTPKLAVHDNNDVLDDSSLIPASVTDDSSYVNVVPSAPNSLNTCMTTRSLEDLVVVDRDGGRND